MTNLQSIQENTSAFNIECHLQSFIAEAIMSSFLDADNKAKIENALKIRTKPYDLRSFIIGIMFQDFVKAYLADTFDDEEDDEEED